MKNRLLVLVTLLSVISYGQSKKEINAAYRDEVSKLKNTYDSCVTAYLAAEKQLEQSRKNVRTELRLLDDQRQLVSKKIVELTRKTEKLISLGVDVKPYISKEELNSSNLPKYDLSQSNKELFKEVFSFNVVYDTLQLEKMRIKEQNPALMKQIEVYKSALAYNKETIKREQNTIRQLDSINNSLMAVKIQMETTSLYYQKKLNLLDEKLAELKENYRLKGPKGFSDAYERIFPDVFPKQVPPRDEIRVTHMEEYDYDRDMVAPPPLPPPTPSVILDIVEEPAEFPGGTVALMQYLNDHLVYPQKAVDLGIEGKCYLKFVVVEDGSIFNITVARGVPDCKECDDEAIRLVEEMPKWKPGKNNNEPVKQSFGLPIQFKLK